MYVLGYHYLRERMERVLGFLFGRDESRNSAFAIESIALIYNALTTLAIFMLFEKLDNPERMLYERLGIVLVTLLLMFVYKLRPCRFTSLLRVVFQMSLLAYWYPETYEFNSALPNLDYLFAGADQLLFGCQPSLAFSEHYPYKWLSEAFNMGYFFYYPMIFIVVMYYFVRHFECFEKVAFVLTASFFVYYVFYILVPVAGPQFYFPAIGMENVVDGNFFSIGDYFHHNRDLLPAPRYADGFFYKLVESSQQVGERPTAAFPSSHVAISTIAMFLALEANRRLAFLLFPFYVLLCCATVYIQAHYLVDSIMGFLTSFLVLKFVMILHEKYFSATRLSVAKVKV